MATVPDTDTFSLQDVVDAVTGSQDDLIECFSEANEWGFDLAYKGSQDNLLDFRNYDGASTIHAHSLRHHISSSSSACAASSSTIYGDHSVFNSITKFFTSSAGTTAAGAGYYSNGSNWKFWTTNSVSSSGSC